MVNTYAVQSGGCRFESLWGFGFFLKGAHYEVDYCGKKTYLAGLQCTLTSSCAKSSVLEKNYYYFPPTYNGGGKSWYVFRFFSKFCQFSTISINSQVSKIVKSFIPSSVVCGIMQKTMQLAEKNNEENKAENIPVLSGRLVSIVKCEVKYLSTVFWNNITP